MKTYEIHANREDRAIYYAAEYGVAEAVKILANEPKQGRCLVRAIGGTAKKQRGCFRLRRDADRYTARIREMIASFRGKIHGENHNGGSVEVVRA